ncbi:hypothetical protein [Paraburkholderia phytofirmans]|uniref:Uncharacterized protein n=1 Tax=Paraburkholderia phytofirmans (strain DSM 17436 / LMG 22146 / PsJN) TaxID=398527 RepID=B2TGE7_PARPJ|nr:hypothetical protein [Paraburkholderia phytofirmans]ACD20119.1 hypothetical protein Bphyt_5780 [Paraburkholderia phytofirmans PsJN]
MLVLRGSGQSMVRARHCPLPSTPIALAMQNFKSLVAISTVASSSATNNSTLDGAVLSIIPLKNQSPS